MGTTALVGAALALAAPAAAQDYGLFWNGPGKLTTSNGTGSVLQGNLAGVYAGPDGEIAFGNSGTVRGNDPALAGIVLEHVPSIVTNSGLISGAGFGILAQDSFPSAPSITNVWVQNFGGTIVGDSNDGVRIVGNGGWVENEYGGLIEGRVGGFAGGFACHLVQSF
jgi:hypothetical protein